jgi:hypothetical protein
LKKSVRKKTNLFFAAPFLNKGPGVFYIKKTSVASKKKEATI